MVKIKCDNCIYSRFNECFCYPEFRWDEPIPKNHRELKEILNKNNDCKFHTKWTLKLFIKELLK
jgi:hypothetical protein